MTTITHLVVAGDSFTYCSGLENREVQGWPYLLSRDLGCQVVNLAVPGTGNDTIHRRIYEYTLCALGRGNRPFFIIAWSQFWRKETWFEEDLAYKPIGHPGNGGDFYNEFQKTFLKNFNDEDHTRRTYLYKASLVCLFNHFKLPYLMSDYSSDAHALDTKWGINESYYDKLLDFMQFCHDKFHVSPLCDQTKDSPKTPCLHDGVQGNSLIKDFLLDQIADLHGPLTIDAAANVLQLGEFEQKFQKPSCPTTKSIPRTS